MRNWRILLFFPGKQPFLPTESAVRQLTRRGLLGELCKTWAVKRASPGLLWGEAGRPLGSDRRERRCDGHQAQTGSGEGTEEEKVQPSQNNLGV